MVAIGTGNGNSWLREMPQAALRDRRPRPSHAHTVEMNEQNSAWGEVRVCTAGIVGMGAGDANVLVKPGDPEN